MMKKLSPITFFIVAGEPSGDAHGASLMRAIKKEKPESRFVGHGGDGMTKEGLERMYHTNQLGIVGFSEVIKHLPFMLTAMNRSLERLKLLVHFFYIFDIFDQTVLLTFLLLVQ